MTEEDSLKRKPDKKISKEILDLKRYRVEENNPHVFLECPQEITQSWDLESTQWCHENCTSEKHVYHYYGEDIPLNHKQLFKLKHMPKDKILSNDDVLYADTTYYHQWPEKVRFTVFYVYVTEEELLNSLKIEIQHLPVQFGRLLTVTQLLIHFRHKSMWMQYIGLWIKSLSDRPTYVFRTCPEDGPIEIKKITDKYRSRINFSLSWGSLDLGKDIIFHDDAQFCTHWNYRYGGTSLSLPMARNSRIHGVEENYIPFVGREGMQYDCSFIADYPKPILLIIANYLVPDDREEICKSIESSQALSEFHECIKFSSVTPLPLSIPDEIILDTRDHTFAKIWVLIPVTNLASFPWTVKQPCSTYPFRTDPKPLYVTFKYGGNEEKLTCEGWKYFQCKSDSHTPIKKLDSDPALFDSSVLRFLVFTTETESVKIFHTRHWSSLVFTSNYDVIRRDQKQEFFEHSQFSQVQNFPLQSPDYGPVYANIKHHQNRIRTSILIYYQHIKKRDV